MPAADPPPPDEEPLLVRPYVHAENPGTPPPSDQTWPAGATRPLPRVAAHRGAGGPIVLPGRIAIAAGRRRARMLIPAAAVAGVIALAVAGIAVFRPAAEPARMVVPPADPLPAASGPASVAPASSAPAGAATSAATPSATARATHTGTPGAPTRAGTRRPSPTVRASATASATAARAPQDLRSPAPTLSAVPAAARTGTITGAGGFCLDLNGAVPVPGNHIQVYDCNGTVAQRWTLATDGTLRVMGLCALVTGDGTVHVTICDRNTASQWRAGPNRSLVTLAGGRCLTEPERRSGAGVRVGACSGAGDQQWALPG
ncbi:ricin-type beta-trefoil lectin domain protein [Mangrovihabitans endophyticus]|uniref:Ricin B lectin domain-containing protein n=1 Tax=Mangrovihabitans endophyticus TaxID=1751298 RepID=A0A8J3C847_9ACTN|nr:ricin-type beta-trefoil lectin domain protein [Mangrovihabitans endophyticus]GGL19295.1 hypothetical protein GCM10012284_62290 [Mangrovihabitans endophyticus]